MEKAIYIVLNQELKNMEAWRMSNTVFILGIGLGSKISGFSDEYFGVDVTDGSGIVHSAISKVVLPILEIQESQMNDFYLLSKSREQKGILEIIDFTLTAQNSREYTEYTEKISSEKIEDQLILGVAFCGNVKAVKSLCGSLARWK